MFCQSTTQSKTELSEIDRCLQELEKFCGGLKIASENQHQFSIVLDDLLNNIVNYAYEDDGKEHVIDVLFLSDG